MKKPLVVINVVLYAILYSLSLLYIGYEYGEGLLFPYPRGPEYLVLPAVYLILLLVELYLGLGHGYRRKRDLLAMAAITLVYASVLWASRLFFYSQGRMTMSTDLDIYWYPGTMFVASLVISAIYVICAVREK